LQAGVTNKPSDYYLYLSDTKRKTSAIICPRKYFDEERFLWHRPLIGSLYIPGMEEDGLHGSVSVCAGLPKLSTAAVRELLLEMGKVYS